MLNETTLKFDASALFRFVIKELECNFGVGEPGRFQSEGSGGIGGI